MTAIICVQVRELIDEGHLVHLLPPTHDEVERWDAGDLLHVLIEADVLGRLFSKKSPRINACVRRPPATHRMASPRCMQALTTAPPSSRSSSSRASLDDYRDAMEQQWSSPRRSPSESLASPAHDGTHDGTHELRNFKIIVRNFKKF